MSISKRQISDAWIIGFDVAENKLLYLQLTAKKADGFLVDLTEVSSFTVIKDNMPFWNGRERAGVSMATISLKLTYKNGAKPLVFPFYDNRIDPVYDLRDRAKQHIQHIIFVGRIIIGRQHHFKGSLLLQYGVVERIDSGRLILGLGYAIEGK